MTGVDVYAVWGGNGFAAVRYSHTEIPCSSLRPTMFSMSCVFSKQPSNGAHINIFLRHVLGLVQHHCSALICGGTAVNSICLQPLNGTDALPGI